VLEDIWVSGPRLRADYAAVLYDGFSVFPFHEPTTPGVVMPHSSFVNIKDLFFLSFSYLFFLLKVLKSIKRNVTSSTALSCIIQLPTILFPVWPFILFFSFSFFASPTLLPFVMDLFLPGFQIPILVSLDIKSVSQ